MLENNNTQSYPCQYANVFACGNTNSYIRGMDKMREILKELMSRAGDDAYSLEVKSKVPQPTTQRFLSGRHGDPRSSTVKKWANAYGITESQLRGDVPIDGLAVAHIEKNDLPARNLTPAQTRALSLIGRLDQKTQNEFLGLFEKLIPERRKKNIGHEPERRWHLGPDIPPDPHDLTLYEPEDEIEQPGERRRRDGQG
jgi:hypothetical protein